MSDTPSFDQPSFGPAPDSEIARLSLAIANAPNIDSWQKAQAELKAHKKKIGVKSMAELLKERNIRAASGNPCGHRDYPTQEDDHV